jgi:hypothetical protein
MDSDRKGPVPQWFLECPVESSNGGKRYKTLSRSLALIFVTDVEPLGARRSGYHPATLACLGRTGCLRFPPLTRVRCFSPQVAALTPVRRANLGASRGREMIYDNKPVDFALQIGA